MLVELRLENFVLFEKAVFTFGAGLTAISGETGAGKSLIARALALALGDRGGQDAIRADCPAAEIAAAFMIREAGLAEALAESGVPANRGDSLRFERSLKRSSPGRLTVNGTAIAAHAVRGALPVLVDFSAQNEQVRLAEPEYQRELLDRFGGLDAGEYFPLRRRAEELHRRLDASEAERTRQLARRERVREDLERLRVFGYSPAADAAIEDRIRETAHAAEVSQAALEALDSLSDGETPAAGTVASVRKRLERLSDRSSAVREAVALLAEVEERLSSVLDALRQAAAVQDSDPEELDRLINRAEDLKSLARRMGCRPEELPDLEKRLREEEAKLAAWGEGEDEARDELKKLLPRLAKAGLDLSRRRREAALRLSKAVNRELAGLGMNKNGFMVDFDPLWSEGDDLEKLLNAGTNGLEEVVFLIAPNPGEPASPLSKTASGGEAARALLALKAALADAHRPPLLFLDEVDAGVGGRLGAALGEKLKALSKGRQVVVITHLPQIAAYADRHLRVAKRVVKGRTVAVVEELDRAGRVEEMAQMIHGASAGDITRRQAEEMLEQAGGGHGGK